MLVSGVAGDAMRALPVPHTRSASVRRLSIGLAAGPWLLLVARRSNAGGAWSTVLRLLKWESVDETGGFGGERSSRGVGGTPWPLQGDAGHATCRRRATAFVVKDKPAPSRGTPPSALARARHVAGLGMRCGSAARVAALPLRLWRGSAGVRLTQTLRGRSSPSAQRLRQTDFHAEGRLADRRAGPSRPIHVSRAAAPARAARSRAFPR
jgi:hypothetical protein